MSLTIFMYRWVRLWCGRGLRQSQHLDQACTLMLGQNSAQKLLGAVKDANKYTDIEKATMKNIRDNYKFTDASDQWFRTEIQKWAGTK